MTVRSVFNLLGFVYLWFNVSRMERFTAASKEGGTKLGDDVSRLVF